VNELSTKRKKKLFVKITLLHGERHQVEGTRKTAEKPP